MKHTRPRFSRSGKFLPLLAAAMPLLARAEGAAPPELGGSVWQMFLSLGGVLLLLVGSLWLLKRMIVPRADSGKLVRVIAGTAVGARERVVVVEIGDNWLVLGIAPGRITSLHQMPRQEIHQESTVAEKSLTLAGKDFAAWLKQVMDRRNAG